MERSEEIVDLRKRVEELERDLQQVRVRLGVLEGSESPAEEPPDFSAQFELPVQKPAPAPEPAIAAKLAPPPLPAERPIVPPPVPARKPAGPPVRREPGFLDALFEQLRGYGPPKDMAWEMALGTWWLPRIGVVVLSVAVVWMLSLALDRMPQQWLPWIRLGIGYGIALGLMAFGKWAERKDKGYARVVMGGGLGLLYLATFATHYIPYTQVVPVPAPTLLALGVLVAWWMALAQWRRSRLMAVVVTALGQFTVALSTLTLAQPSPYAIGGLIAIAIGSAFFLARNGWFTVATLGMLMSHGNYFLWLLRSPGSTAFSAFLLSLHLVTTFFFIFAAADFLASDGIRRERIALKLRTAYATLNTVAALVLGLALVQGFALARGNTHLLYWGFGAVLLALSAAYVVLRRKDPLYHAYLTKGVVLTTIGLAIYLEGSRLTATLAVEAVVLLWASRRPGMLSTRLLAFGVAGIAFVLGFVQGANALSGGAPVPLADVVITIVAFLALSLLYQWTNWAPASAQRRFRTDLQELFWDFDLVAAPSEVNESRSKPLDGRLFPYLFAMAATALIILQTVALAGDYPGVTAAGAALVILLIAVIGQSRALSLCALLCAIAAGLLQAGVLLENGGPLWSVYGAVALGSVLAIASEKCYFFTREGLLHFHTEGMPYVLYLLPAILLVLHFNAEPISNVPVVMLGCAIAAALLTRVLHAGALSVVTTLFLFASLLHYFRAVERGAAPDYAVHLLFWTQAAVAVGLERYFASWRKERLFQALCSAMMILTAAFVLVYVHYMVRSEWHSFVYGLFTLGFLAHAGINRRYTSLTLAVGAALLASAYHIFTADDFAGSTASFYLGNAVWLLFWVTLERGAAALRLEKSLAEMRDQILPILVTIAIALLASFIYDFAGPYLSIGWTIAAVALIGGSIPLRQPFYRYGGLLLLLIVLGRVFLIDTATLDPIFRIAAGGFLGLVLLALGFGYVKARERGKKSG
jgi:hypothetical protein